MVLFRSFGGEVSRILSRWWQKNRKSQSCISDNLKTKTLSKPLPYQNKGSDSYGCFVYNAPLAMAVTYVEADSRTSPVDTTPCNIPEVPRLYDY